MKNCIFCQPNISTETIILENQFCLFLQRKEPILIGSGLIVPRQHKETVFDLSPDEWRATQEILQQVKKLLDKECQPDGYNVGWNCGVTAGQEVFHAHLHVLPRYKDEPLAGKGIRYWLKQENNQRKSPPKFTD